MRALVLIVILWLAGGAVRPAHAVVITFDGIPVGTVITDQFAGLGVTFSLLGSPPVPGPTISRTIYDAQAFGFGFENITTGLDPADDQFDLLIAFSAPIDFFSIFVLDAEEPFSMLGSFQGFVVEIAMTTDLGHLAGPASGPLFFAALGAIGGVHLFDAVLIDITNGSGSDTGGPEVFDHVVFNPLPLPEPSPLAPFGILALVAFAFRHAARRTVASGSRTRNP